MRDLTMLISEIMLYFASIYRAEEDEVVVVGAVAINVVPKDKSQLFQAQLLILEL